MILTGENGHWYEEFISLDYDVKRAILDLYESGLYDSAPYWCKITENLLRTGEISHGSVLSQAMAYCYKETGSCNWPDIPETYWHKAVSEML